MEPLFIDNNLNLSELGKKYVFNTYNRFPISLKYGNGNYLFDANDKKYLDFVSGIAVNCLGYNNTKINEAITQQSVQLMHCSNLYWNEPMINLAKSLVELSGLGKAFFCNSGAEAIEAALKLARIKGTTTKGQDCYEIVAMKQSFHGRTFGAISATGQPKYHEGFYPLLPGIKHVDFNDIEALSNAISDKTCAILLEPIQGEGGIIEVNPEYLSQVKMLCDKHNITLIFDEIQCGVGRTGKFFAFQNFDVKPDIVVLAKGLAGGFPIGAMLGSDEVASYFTPGKHASTFGGNPLACHVASIVVGEVLQLLNHVNEVGNYLKNELLSLSQIYKDEILDVRGIGLMQGIEFNFPVNNLIAFLMDKNILTLSAGERVLRIVPPLICTVVDVERLFIEIRNFLVYENKQP